MKKNSFRNKKSQKRNLSRKKNLTRKKKLTKKRIKRKLYKNILKGGSSGSEPEPEPETVVLTFRGKTPEEYIRDIIKGSVSINPQIIIDFLESNSIDLNTYGDKISPPLLSRLGDIKMSEYELLGMRFIEILYSFIKILSTSVDSSRLPSVYDAIALDSKVHYMEILLAKGLCDDSTIILYYNLNTGEEYKDKRSLRTSENIVSLTESEGSTYYIKTPFSGASACAFNVRSDDIISMEDLIELTTGRNYCIGKFYGLIIQKENPKFQNIHREIRCCCFEGHIKSISSSKGTGIFPIKVLGIHKSVYSKLLEKVEPEDDIFNVISKEKLIMLYNYLLTSENEYGEYIGCRNLLSEMVYDGDYSGINSEELIITEHVADLQEKCSAAFSLLKSGLNLEGSHHRIDLIKSRDNESYIINEVENINFGNVAADALNLFLVDYDIIIYLRRRVDLVLDGEITEAVFNGIMEKRIKPVNPDLYSLISGYGVSDLGIILNKIYEIIKNLSNLNLRVLLLLFDAHD